MGNIFDTQRLLPLTTPSSSYLHVNVILVSAFGTLGCIRIGAWTWTRA